MSRPLGRSGLRVGPHSFGGAPIGNLARPVAEPDWRAAVDAAWAAGVRYFDVAPHYGLGLAERRLGAALADRPRDEFVVSTKVGRLLVPRDDSDGAQDDEGFAVPAAFTRVRDYSRDGVLRSLEASLQRMGLERIDLVLVHDPDDDYREALEGAFPALDELRAAGAVRSYGAGMNQSAMLTEFVRHTDLDVVLLAGRYTLLDQSGLDDLLPLCHDRGVSVVAGGVFNSGILASDRLGQDATFDYRPVPPELCHRVRRIAEICERHGTTLPAVAARFPLGHPAVATVCLGARSGTEVTRNAALFARDVPTAVRAELVDRGLLHPDAPWPAPITGEVSTIA